MRSFLLTLAAGLVAAQEVDLTKQVNNEEIIAAVNSHPTAKWTAGHNDKFANMTLAQAKRYLGTKKSGPERDAAKARMSKWDLKSVPTSQAPAAFNVLSAWPQCASVSGHIRDQSDCGSCGAFGSTEAFNDRLCINYNFTTLLSPLDTMACCDWANGCIGSSGCDGGIPEEAYSYFISNGVVTGGDYGSSQSATCANYPFAQCSHHEAGKYPACASTEYNTPNCPTACTNTGYSGQWSTDKHFGKTGYNLNSVQDAMTDIAARGSITAAFNVYEDFLTYKSGIYQYTSGALLGGHAVKIVGWNSTDGTDYWIVANSWNEYWGQSGFFWILKGVDECGIEDDLSAGTV